MEDGANVSQQKMLEMEKALHLIQSMNEDIEVWSQQNNTFIIVLAESTNWQIKVNCGLTTIDVIGGYAFSKMFMVERAHMSLNPRPPLVA